MQKFRTKNHHNEYKKTAKGINLMTVVCLELLINHM